MGGQNGREIDPVLSDRLQNLLKAQKGENGICILIQQNNEKELEKSADYSSWLSLYQDYILICVCFGSKKAT